MVQTSGSLGYAYDDLKPAGTPPTPVPLRPAGTIEVPTGPAAIGLGKQPLSKPLTVSKKMPVSLKGGSVALNFSVPGGASGRMQTMAEPAAQTPSLTLVLKDVRATPAGIQKGVDYRIYLNLPQGFKDQFKHDDFYLGSINSFALSHHGGAHAQTLTFDLSALAPALGRVGQWSSSRVSVSLVSDDDDTAQALLEIGDVQLLLSDVPLK